MAVEIFSGVEGVVRFGDVSGQDCGVQFRFVPVALLERCREFCAEDADLPRQQAGLFEFRFAVFADGGFVDARKRGVREAAVAVEIDEMIVTFRGRFGFRIQRIGDVKREIGAIFVEEGPQVGRQRVDCFADDDALCAGAPSDRVARRERRDQCDGDDDEDRDRR
jgi:hypothetical protein